MRRCLDCFDLRMHPIVPVCACNRLPNGSKRHLISLKTISIMLQQEHLDMVMIAKFGILLMILILSCKF